MRSSNYHFEPSRHEGQLVPIIREIRALDRLEPRQLDRILRLHPKDGRGVFSKSEIIRGFRHFADRYGWDDRAAFVERVRMKPVRTRSGVAPVTVLTQPYPCPGKCVFCPNDVRMPKSYLAREPGAQRAAQHRFDPYRQTLSRLLALHHNGHHVDKVELIVLGGTWSFYPEPYQVWFVKRCFDALNDFDPSVDPAGAGESFAAGDDAPGPRFDELTEEVDGRAAAPSAVGSSYNRVVSGFLRRQLGGRLTAGDGAADAGWQELAATQRRNETSHARCVGLVLETRPDHLPPREVERLRRLGATKVQIGIQSLSDRVLAANRRGHDVAATRRAVARLRRAGFKLHAHWMPNLLGSDPERDRADFERLFADPGVCPDELKIYPCSLIESAELMRHYEDGSWRPYGEEELLELLCHCLAAVPPYCRVTRMIRDIPGDEIHAGNRVTNFRQLVERELRRRGRPSRDVRAREIGGRPVDPDELRLDRVEYRSTVGRELFLQVVTGEDRIVGFCRLTLPEPASPETLAETPPEIPELAGAALLREVHVYGAVVAIGARDDGRAQHLGLGRRLVAEAAETARAAGYPRLAVISAVGTRDYYRGLGFTDGDLYQHLELAEGAARSTTTTPPG